MRMTGIILALALVAGVFLTAGEASAQAVITRYIWDNDDGDSNWGVDANWRTEWDADGDLETEGDRTIYNDPSDATHGYTYPTGNNPNSPTGDWETPAVELNPDDGTPTGGHTINVNVSDAGTWKWTGFAVVGDVGNVTLSSATNTLLGHQFVNETANTLQISCDTINQAGKQQFVTRTTDANGQIIVDGGISGDTDIWLQPQGLGPVTFTSNVTVGGTPGNWYPYFSEGTLDMVIERADLLAQGWYSWMGVNSDGVDTARLRLIWGADPSAYNNVGVRLTSAGGEVQFMAKGDVDSNYVMAPQGHDFMSSGEADTKVIVGGNYDSGTGVCDVTLLGQGTGHNRVQMPVEILAGSKLIADADAHDIQFAQVGLPLTVSGAGQLLIPEADYSVGIWGGATVSCETKVESGGTLWVSGGTMTGDLTVEAGGTSGVTNDYRGSQEWIVTGSVSGSGDVLVDSTHASRTATMTMGAGGSLGSDVHLSVGPNMDYGSDQSFFNMNGQGNVTIGKLSGRGTVYTGGDTLTVSSLSPSAMHTTMLKGLEIQGGSGALVLDSGGTHIFKIVRTSYDVGSDEVNVTSGASVTLGGAVVIDLAGGLADMEPGLTIRDENLINCGAGLGGTTFDAVGWVNSGIWGYEITYDDGAGTVNLITHVAGDITGDDKVDGQDLTALAANWDQSGVGWAGGDLNQDGSVNGLDLTLLAANWDNQWTPPAGIPEPATLALLSLGGAALLRRRRRS